MQPILLIFLACVSTVFSFPNERLERPPRSADSPPAQNKLPSPRSRPVQQPHVSLGSRTQSNPLQTRAQSTASAKACPALANSSEAPSRLPVNATEQQMWRAVAGIAPLTGNASSPLPHPSTSNPSLKTHVTARADSPRRSGVVHSSRSRVNYFDQSETWRTCYNRGQRNANGIKAALSNGPLGDFQVPDRVTWQRSGIGLAVPFLGPRYCIAGGIVARLYPRVCDELHEFTGQQWLFTLRSFSWQSRDCAWTYFRNFPSMGLAFIYALRDRSGEIDPSSISLDGWPDAFWSVWSNSIATNLDDPSSLYHLVFEVSGTQMLEVIEDIWTRQPSLRAVAYATPILSLTPADDDFYAIIGTDLGALVPRLLQQYAASLAIRDRAPSRDADPLSTPIKATKNITSIDIAGMAFSEEKGRLDPSGEFRFDMMVNLEDVKAPWVDECPVG